MTSISFKHLTLVQITREDLADLRKALDEDPDRNWPEVRDRIVKGDASLWRYRNGDGRGIVVTTLEPSSLFVWYLAGNKMEAGIEYMYDVLAEFAKLHGKKRITAITKPGVSRAMRKHGFGVDLHFIGKEI